MPLGAKTLLAGVVDLSARAWRDRPEPEACLRRALELQDLGADLIDLSVIPLSGPLGRLDPDDEMRRLVPTLRKVRARVDVPVGVTTFHSQTAERALGLEAAVILDPSGLAVDPRLGAVVNQTDAGLVLGHLPGGLESWNKPRPAVRLVETVAADLDSALARARRAGIDRRRVVVDPGLGVGKRGQQDFELLERLSELEQLGQPMLVTPSRKLFLTETVRAPEGDWNVGAAVVTALAVRGGAHIIRAVELAPVRAAARLADRLLESFEAPRI